jgi:hypothetical protein
MMKKYHFLKTAALLALCCAIFGCGKDNKLGSIYGTVTDYVTGDPVGNANVRLNPGGETTLTGSDGTYQFNDVANGNYSLSLSKNGYVDMDDDYVIEIENGNSVRRDLQLSPEVFGAISGTVIDLDTGEPIAGAVVALSPSGMNIYTGDDGRFEFLDLDSPLYTVTGQKTGYITNRKTVATIAGCVVEINLTLKKNNEKKYLNL